jgi:hypothetical protein
MEAAGPLYQAVRGRFGEAVDLQVVDPRNLVTLIVLLIRDFRDHGVRIRDAVRTLFTVPTQGVLVNGRLFAKGGWPPADDLVELLEGLVSPSSVGTR